MQQGFTVNKPDWEIEYCKNEFEDDPTWQQNEWIRKVPAGILVEIHQGEIKAASCIQDYNKFCLYSGTFLSVLLLNFLIVKNTNLQSPPILGAGIIANAYIIRNAIHTARKIDSSPLEPQCTVLDLLKKHQNSYADIYDCERGLVFNSLN